MTKPEPSKNSLIRTEFAERGIKLSKLGRRMIKQFRNQFPNGR